MQMSKGGNGARKERYVALKHYMLKSPAWRSLDAVARALYVELAKRYMGSNNGRIPYSVREGAAELGVSKTTVSRALLDLIDRRFIEKVKAAAFNMKNERHATEFRLTEFPCNVTNTAIASHDYMRWQYGGPERLPVPGTLVVSP
jgi:DNA-binding transcriptional regulator YhcF (GntR family)